MGCVLQISDLRLERYHRTSCRIFQRHYITSLWKVYSWTVWDFKELSNKTPKYLKQNKNYTVIQLWHTKQLTFGQVKGKSNCGNRCCQLFSKPWGTKNESHRFMTSQGNFLKLQSESRRKVSRLHFLLSKTMVESSPEDDSISICIPQLLFSLL